MRLTHLSITGVRSIVKTVEIEFPESGLFLIKGENGVGKSSILMSISHLLGFSPIPATALQSNLTDEPFQILGRFETDQPGDEIWIGKGKKTFFNRNGVKVEGAKNVEAKILEVFHGLDSDLRRLLTYRPQRKPGIFLSLPDARKKDFLSSVIPELAKYEKASEASEEALEKLAEVEKRTGWELERAQLAIAGAIDPTPPAVPNIKTEVERLDQLNLTVSELGIQLSRLQADKKNADISHKTKEYSIKLDAATDELKRLDQERRTLGSAMSENVKKWAELDSIKTQILYFVKLIEATEKGVCPTCERSWEDASKVLETYIESRDRLVKKAKDLIDLRLVIDDQEIELKQINVDFDKLKEEAYQLQAWLAHTEDLAFAGINMAIAEVSEQLRVAQQEQSKYNEFVRFTKNNYLRMKELYENESKVLAGKRFAVQEAVKKHDEAASAVKVEKDCLALTRGFHNSIFDDILVDISDRTNKILSRVDNVADTVIEFRSSYETAKKTIQRRITPFVTVQGKEVELEHGPSGGMYSSIELAVDLAVSEVVSQRSGFSPGFLILDEPFNGVSVKSKEAALEVLRVWSQDRLVIVVDHEGSFQGLFSNAIEVINDGTTAVREAS